MRSSFGMNDGESRFPLVHEDATGALRRVRATDNLILAGGRDVTLPRRSEC
jgi:hypothetical protein